MTEIPYTFSDDDVILVLDALSSYRMLAESEMLSSFGDKRVSDECSVRMSKISSIADGIKKAYFESLKGACPHEG